VDLTSFAREVGVDGEVTIAGRGTRGGAVPGVRCVEAPSGIEWIQADEMTVACGAGTPVDDLAAALAEVGQRCVLPSGGTVGGALAVGRSSIRRLGDGPVRDALLQAHYVGADGALVKAGGPTVKNVSGFDVCRLLVGSNGTLGFLGDVILRTRPSAACSEWFTRETADPMSVFAAVHRPVSVLWDGDRVYVLLEGHHRDVAAAAAQLSLDACAAPPTVPTAQIRARPADVVAITARLAPGTFVAELGLGLVHVRPDALTAVGTAGDPGIDPGVAAIARRVKREFDPSGRLNPGRSA
jgi:FAD/FMN-containing dehydrogenase